MGFRGDSRENGVEKDFHLLDSDICLILFAGHCVPIRNSSISKMLNDAFHNYLCSIRWLLVYKFSYGGINLHGHKKEFKT